MDLSDSEDEEQDTTWPIRRPATKQPRRAPCQHPAMVLVGAPVAPVAACCKPSNDVPDTPMLQGTSGSSCSADSTCTSAGGDVASCGAFPQACPARVGGCGAAARCGSGCPLPPRAPVARPVASAATAPPELCREDDDGECMGPPRCKRARFGSAAALGMMRRTKSVPRSLTDLLQEGQGDAATPNEEF